MRNRLARRAVRPRRATARAGFTLVELVVAILVLTIGLLGLASTAAVVTRQMGSAAQQTIAAQTAQSRFEQLRSNYNCAALSDGSANAGKNVTETWTVTNGTGVVTIRDSVAYRVRGQAKYQIYRSMLPCKALN
jgi:type IV pilus modification protein PilV